MAITVRNCFQKDSEQNIKSKTGEIRSVQDDPGIGKKVFAGIKRILEKDQYNLLETKSSELYDRKISKASKLIDNLIEMNSKGKTTIKALKIQLKMLKDENQKVIDLLKEKLR